MLDGFGQRARRARSVLKHHEIRGPRVRRIGGARSVERSPEGVIDLDHSSPRKLRAERLGTLLGKDEAGLAIVDPEREPLWTKQREQWHGDGAALDDPE